MRKKKGSESWGEASPSAYNILAGRFSPPSAFPLRFHTEQSWFLLFCLFLVFVTEPKEKQDGELRQLYIEQGQGGLFLSGPKTHITLFSMSLLVHLPLFSVSRMPTQMHFQGRILTPLCLFFSKALLSI